ncbi:metallophosphoesterase [Anaeromicropila populeti]|uniref:Phosphoesterase n=1 Tax=Anaeromicropila populeti TaxID=37658 RepID=A0A1I6K174_9FIRM|nr:metallophosphoesterase [Anaeromicropila populeti]SFR84848.1 hypothetical protein SAMN05661086_02170 [Anaeromicropila populeti]
MKILVISDSHGKNANLAKVLDKVGTIDMFIHLGDLEGSEDFIDAFVEGRKEIISGNNDFFTDIPQERLMTIGKYTVFLTHGHRYGVHFDLTTLKEAARSRNADIVMFGHTHIPVIDQSSDIIAVNPGSISLPRQPGRQPSYIIMELDRFGEMHFSINYL